MELMVFMRRDVRRRSVQPLGVREGTLDKSMPITGSQVFKDGKEAKTPFLVYFGGGHSTSDYIGKGVTDTGCSRFLIGQNTLDKWELMLAENGT